MALVFGTNCDSSLNESITNTPPDTASNVTVDTTNSKFGAGSAKFTYSASLIWRNFAIDPLDNNGAVGIWLYFDSTKRAIYRFEIHEEVGGGTTTNQVQILVDNRYLGSKLRLYLHMRDNAGVYWININDTALSYVAPGWHYLELNWLWNDASGITELS